MSTRWFLPLALAIAAIMVASLVLGYFSYEAGSRIAARSEQTLERANQVEGQKLIERIERVIIDSDRTLFRMVQLGDANEFNQLWRRIVRANPVLHTVVVLDEQLNILHLVSRGQGMGAGRASFRRTFSELIVPAMDLPGLPPNAHRHLHKAFDGQQYLISFIRRRTAGHNYFVALIMNLPYLRKEIFKEEFQGLQETKYIAVLDDDGQVLYGKEAPDAGQFVFEERFPTTLYRWRLQVAPRAVETLRKEARTRRATNVVFIILANALILVGMLTLLVAVRQERRANELKSVFISNVTHELKTPLSLIHMFAELLATGRASGAEAAREYAEIITRESDRLSRLIDNVLDFARIERGKAANDFCDGDLGAVVARAVDLVRFRAEQAGMALSVELDPDLPAVRMDDNAMTLLVLNLLENALKYGGGGAGQGGEIRVKLGSRGDGEVALQVADQGAGIPPHELARVFDRFYRGAATQGSGTRGSGIGLSLVKHIAEAHGGRAVVASEVGQGTVFTVIIPIRGA